MNPEDDDSAGRSLDRAGLFFGVAIPVVTLIVIAIIAAFSWNRFTEPYPMYWGEDGGLDGGIAPVARFWIPFGLAVVIALPMSAFAAFARRGRYLRSLLLPLGLGILGLTATIALEPLLLAGNEVTPALDLRWASLAVFLGVVLGGVGATQLSDGRARPAASAPPVADLPRAPIEETVMVLPQANWMKWVLFGVTVVLMLVLGWLEPWLGLIVVLLMIPTFISLYPFRTRIGAHGMVTLLGFLEVQRIAAREVVGAQEVEVKLADFGGGVGYRLVKGGVGMIAGRGPAVRVDLAGGRHVTLGCTDVDTAWRAAGILNSAADAAVGAGSRR